MSRTMMGISSMRWWDNYHPLQLKFVCNRTLGDESRLCYQRCLDDITIDTSDLYDSYDLRGLTEYEFHNHYYIFRSRLNCFQIRSIFSK